MEHVDSKNERDWGPPVRLLTVGTLIVLGLHVIPSWHNAVGNVSTLPLRLLEGFITIALVSFVLAQVYLALAMIPVVVAVHLNHWVYESARVHPGPPLAIQ